MMNRRTFLAMTSLAGAGLAVGCKPTSMTDGDGPPDGPTPRPVDVTKYVDPLPVPAVLEPVSRADGVDSYDVTLSEFDQQLHSELPPTTVWGYNGTYPGATIEARVGTPVRVRYVHDLPEEHLLPVDTTLHGAEPDKPRVRVVTHLHGGHVDPEADGYPEEWISAGKTQEVEYRNDQAPATLWFHDHAMGITRLNVYAGLAAFYLLRDEREDALGLPSGDYEVPIVFQDRTFNDDASLLYVRDAESDVEDSIKPEDFGDVSVVNGRIWPYLEVEPRRYRFRLLNGSNSRFYNMIFRDRETGAEDGPAFVQIGTDDGLLEKPVTIDGRLLMAPAERCDVVIDFAGFEGREFVLHTNAKTPFKSEEQDTDEVVLEEIMLFRVLDAASAPDESVVPETLSKISWLDPAKAAITREITLLEGEDEHERLHLLLDGLMWDDPITEKPALGSTEIWRIINPTEDVHPIHLHLVSFQVLGRTRFDAKKYLEALDERQGDAEGDMEDMEAQAQARVQLAATKPPIADFLDGPMEPPAANEAGLKDTVRANPGTVTDIIATFDIKGRYVWHCHILEHEDHEMMRPFEVG